VKIRAVVDTNVFVSALIRPQGTAGILWRHLQRGSFTAVISSGLVEEIAAVLGHPRIRAKYPAASKCLEEVAALFALRGDLVLPGERIRVCRDPADDFLLETAVAGNAGYLVTGDEDLLAIRKFRRIRIVKPAAFAALLEKS